MTRAPARLLVVLALGACGDDLTGGDAPDAEVAPDAPPPDAPACQTPADCDWLEAYQRDVVGRLAGERELAPGVTLTARASVDERTAVQAYLEAELTRLGYAAERHAYGTGVNVVATRAGTGDEVVVVGAHFDGVPGTPAAADNATGTAVVLAAARYFAGRPATDRSIVFALFDQEEIGLVGSTYFAAKLTDDAAVVAAVHNFDMISHDGDGDRAIELWSPSPALEAVWRAHAEPAGHPVQPVAFEFSDHQAFLDAGFLTVGICEEFVADDHTPHYHQPTDSYDKIDFAYLGSVTRVGLDVIEATATVE